VIEEGNSIMKEIKASNEIARKELEEENIAEKLENIVEEKVLDDGKKFIQPKVDICDIELIVSVLEISIFQKIIAEKVCKMKISKFKAHQSNDQIS
jgi:hypothetical protein